MQRAYRTRLRVLERTLDRWELETMTVITIKLLNYYGQMPGFGPVRTLIKQVQTLDQIAKRSDYIGDIESGELGEEARSLNEVIFNFFLKAKIHATLGRPGTSGWTIGYIHPSSRKRDPDGLIALCGELVLGAAIKGYLRCIQSCQKCNLWFDAKRKSQIFCSSKCREHVLRSTERGRANRAIYMRKYRAGLKRRDSESVRITTKRRL